MVMTGTYGAKHKCLTSCAMRTITFQREYLNYLVVCITQCTLFSIANMFAVPYLWKTYVMEHRNK